MKNEKNVKKTFGNTRRKVSRKLCMTIFTTCGVYLYIYKRAAFFDLRGNTPPRPLALEG